MPPKSRSGKRRPKTATMTEADENAHARAATAEPKKKSRSGARKKPAASVEALQKRNENAVVPPPASGASRGRAASATEEEMDAANDDAGDLFDLLRNEGAAVMLQAQDWRGRYNANDVSGVAEIYSLLAKAAGCSTGVTAIEMQRADCLSIMNRIVNDMAAGNLYGEDPLNKRSKEFKGFKTNFLQFVDHCIREASETGDLYDGTLFLSWLEIISTCSSSKARPLRAAATYMGLQVITSLVAVVNNLSKSRDLKQNQMDTAMQEKSGKEMLKSLQSAVADCQEQIEVVEKYMQDVFTQVFTHRFRDCDEAIRAACMKALGKWMLKHQLVFLTDFYLKYLGWSLNDKNASVRLEVILALKTLTSSESHLAMMDTFIVRFRPRIAEMLRDVEADVVVEAIRLSAILHEHSELDPGHMNVVMSLLMDKNQTIRNTAARASKTLMPTLTEAYRKHRKISSKERVDAGEKQLQGIAQLMTELGDRNNGYAKAIDGLWGVYKVLEEPETIAQTLMLDMSMEEAAILANILVLVIQKSVGEDIVKPNDLSASKTVSAKQRHASEIAHETITKKISAIISDLLNKYQAESEVVGPLVEVVRYVKLEHYSLSHLEHEFTALAEQVKDIFFKHSDKRVLEACGDAFNYFTNDGFEAIKPFAQPVLDATMSELSAKLSPVLKKIRTAMGKSDPSVADESEGHAFELRMAVSRVRALISKCNIASGVDVFSELSQFIGDASRSVVIGRESVSMACSSVSFMLIWRALELMDNESTTVEQVNAHITERDTFVANILHILRRTQDLFDDGDAESANKVERAVISTICDMVLYYYNSSTLPSSHPAHSMRLQLSLRDSQDVWAHCTALITPADTTQDADLNAARLAYRMAMHDEKIAENGALGADFLSNFRIAGPWTDAAIRTYCNDLRRTGPQVLVRAVLTALHNAYDEVLSTDLGNRQLLLEAYSDLATRLSDMFALSSRRDRIVMRILFEEAVNFTLNPEPVYERFPFLAYGLSPFLTKLSAVDAKCLTFRVDDAVGKVDDEDVRSTPLIDFADKLSARSKGATAQGPMKARRQRVEKSADDVVERDDDIEQADDDDNDDDSADTNGKKHRSQTLNDGPVEKPSKRSRRK